MNNCIDERIISYKRRQQPIKIENRIRKGTPLTHKTQKNGVFVCALKAVAMFFLLFVSTFGGEPADQTKDSRNGIVKLLKKSVIYVGIALALWGVLIVISNLANAFTLLPLWSLIVIFGLTVLATSGVMKS